MLNNKPSVHPTAIVIDTVLGAWTEVGARTSVKETVMGDYSYVVNDSQIIYAKIGKFCSIASHTRINPGNHPLDHAVLHHFTYRSRQYQLAEDNEEFFDWRRSYRVTIGHDVWIGHGAVVLPGVKIGTGTAIGAGAVVSKDVLPFMVVGGVPAGVIRERFPKKVQEGLLRICWWNWPRKKLRGALSDFRHLSAKDFVKRYDPAKSTP
ncbi:MAG: chloramphenicol acetyltransferase [Thermodesulfobacteriota bacterium]|nr:chloramphenicol acetyltransferase [Thermodesulfobacteriota bacterium]